jgi:putative endonuclease
MEDRKKLGRWGEDAAATLLEERGYLVVERNWRCHGVGEVDLVARQGDCLVFVEVRARRGRAHGTPEESITAAKQKRLVALVDAYSQAHGWEGDCRIDVIALELDEGGRLIRRRHIENAVTG